MYKRKGADLTIKEVLAKLKNPKYVPPKVVYASSDIKSARAVLDRLIQKAATSEISSIREVPLESRER